MSGEVLSNDQIAALVEAAKQGQLPADSAKTAGRRAGRLRTVDFTRPTKFSNDQERRLSRTLDTFCRTASTRISAELRIPMELEVINVSQLTWSNAHGQIPNGSICAIVEAQPIRTRMLLAAELPLVLAAIERLLSGTSAEAPRERKLSDIDWMLARHFFSTLLHQLSIVWSELAELELDLERLDSPMESAQVAPVSEPTIALTIEVRHERATSTLMLLVPYCAIAPVEAAFEGGEEYGGHGVGGSSADAVQAALRDVEVALRAEVADLELTIDEVLALRAGDMLRFNASTESGVTLCVDSVPVYRAKPGRSGNRRAVQVTDVVGRPE